MWSVGTRNITETGDELSLDAKSSILEGFSLTSGLGDRFVRAGCNLGPRNGALSGIHGGLVTLGA